MRAPGGSPACARACVCQPRPSPSTPIEKCTRRRTARLCAERRACMRRDGRGDDSASKWCLAGRAMVARYLLPLLRDRHCCGCNAREGEQKVSLLCAHPWPDGESELPLELLYLNALDREKRRCLADVSLLLLRITSLRWAASLPQRSAARSIQQPQLGPLGSPAAAPPAERAAGSATRSRLVDYYSLRSRALDHVRCRWPIGSGRAAASLRWPGARSRSPGTRSAGREQATPAGRRLPRAYHIR